MPRDVRPARLLQAATQLVLTKRIPATPPWYSALQKHPPDEPLSKRPAFLYAQHPTTTTQQQDKEKVLLSSFTTPLRQPTTKSRSKKPTKKGVAKPYLRPQTLTYEEDNLRTTFFGDHPWELARPRTVVETSGGNDSKNWDWSQIKQLGKPMDGESVVRRQIWLMEDMRKSWYNSQKEEIEKNIQGEANQIKALVALREQLVSLEMNIREVAYDKARKEFYKVRQEQDVERQVAQEEAIFDGAYFHPGEIERGFDWENTKFEQFRKWAILKAESISQRKSKDYRGSMTEETAGHSSSMVTAIADDGEEIQAMEQFEQNRE